MTAKELVEQLTSGFDVAILTEYFSVACSKFAPDQQDLSELIPEDQTQFKDVSKIGEVEYDDANRLIFAVCRVDKDLSAKDSKKAQYEIGKKILKQHFYDAGIFIFYGANNNFRLSLIVASYQGPKREFTTFRRYTYFVSDELTNKTFIKQFGGCDFSSIDNILEAFSVEAVNKDFYTRIAKKFTDLVGGWLKVGTTRYEREGCLVWPDKSDEKRKEFAVRLIGRLVFCWFLKKKHSEPANVPLIPKDILSLETANNNDSYYHFMLEPLFFQVLNKKLNDRHEKYKANGWDKIPFLNGGLFTPHSDDYYDPDGPQGISARGIVKVPDEWLRELLKIFERYNFTIDENTPVDIEISIDPEMLGRIFENLLAMINPETGETARKSTGSYYTPRPIVEYMVDQSIKQYLLTKSNIPKENIDSLLDYSQELADANLTDKQNDRVIEALDNLKALDPACGSGAFPIGILQKILLILQKVDPDSTKWKIKLLAKVPNTSARKALAEKLEFETWQYIHKLGVIQNSIYGVDIQPIAAEISKLRIFLSLIVDETISDSKDNRGIISLPNLEFKFVCANTLIGIDSNNTNNEGLFDISKISQLKGKLENIRDEYFTCFPSEKQMLIDQFGEIQKELLNYMIDSHMVTAQGQKLIEWKPFNDVPCSWFEPEWMFGLDSRFDIIIGNPPYIQLQNDGGHLANMYENYDYKTFARTGDIYCLFYERGNQLLTDGGCLCYITSNKWTRAKYGKKLRQYLADYTQPLQLIDIGPDVFESATVDTNILIFIKRKPVEIKENSGKLICLKPADKFKAITLTGNEYFQHQSKSDWCDMVPSSEIWTILNPIEQRIEQKIKANGRPLKDWNVEIYRGILTGFNDAFIIDSEKRNELIAMDSKSDEIIKPILRGRDIKRYKAEFANKWLINTHNGYSGIQAIDVENEYPEIKKHFDSYWDRISVRQDKGVTPYNLRSCAYVPEFEKEKVVWKRIGSIMRFSYSNIAEICLDSTCIATGEKIKYLTALLNSKLCLYQLFRTSPKTGTGDQIISVQALEPLCVYYPNSKEEKLIVKYADRILAKKERGEDTTGEEAKIDEMVFELYHLTPEEIGIVKEYVK